MKFKFKDHEDYKNQRKAILDKANALLADGHIEEANAQMAEVEQMDNEYEQFATSQANFNALKGIKPTAGAGFGVVAEEIGKLADSSRETVDKIQEFTNQIGESVTETVAKGEATSEIVSQQSTAIAGVAEELTSLSETASQLVDLARQ